MLNRGFAETMALKRSAGLETVACWQTDAQWIDRDVREQLDALFAHRVYFATASASDARAAVQLTMAEFSDTRAPGHRAHSPRSAIPTRACTCPSTTRSPAGARSRAARRRSSGETIPLRVDPERLALHAALPGRARGTPPDRPAPAALGPGCR